MASGTIGGGNDLNSRERPRWGDKVYTRRNLQNKAQRNINSNECAATASAASAAAAVAATSTNASTAEPGFPPVAVAVPTEHVRDSNKVNDDNENGKAQFQPSPQTLGTEDPKSSPQPQEELPPEEQSEHGNEPQEQVVSRSGDSSNPNREGEGEGEDGSGRIRETVPVQNGGRPLPGSGGDGLIDVVVKPLVTRVEDRVRINLPVGVSGDEIWELRKQLESELVQVRSIAKKLESMELQITSRSHSNGVAANGVVGAGSNLVGFSQPPNTRIDAADRRALIRVNSDMGSVVHQDLRLFRPLSVSVGESNHVASDFIEKEKRTPKANQYYRNSEFLLGKDRLPPESNKRMKPSSGKKHGGETYGGLSFGSDKQRSQMFRSCSNLLQRLMKHKHGWVFNEPVNAKALGLHDYHDIIKHPMDLGTIKTRLSQNWYKSPREFAEDVRLVFRNAMTYNPKGQDVHIMAEQLSTIFEERWAVIEAEYNPNWRYQMYYDAGLPTPAPRKAPPPLFVPAPALSAPQMRTLDRSESMTTPVESKLRPATYTVRTPVPKKPKAKDPNKRDMTFDEKQRLSTHLQSLPSEKLDAIVQIIKKRNSALCQHDDEIEVDIDSVDAETLWELDRFVTNYKKSLSKNKRKAELALQARAEAAKSIPVRNQAPVVGNEQEGTRTGEGNTAPIAISSSAAAAPPIPPVQDEKLADNASRSSSSSSSSSDSGSSSSDSDSDSSSADGSDGGRSPRT